MPLERIGISNLAYGAFRGRVTELGRSNHHSVFFENNYGTHYLLWTCVRDAASFGLICGHTATMSTTLKKNLESLQQKARERTVKTQNIEYDLETLVKKINNKTIKLDPEYQRRHRWSSDTSSRLIESLILNIPIPVIYLSQDVDVDVEVGESVARYTVIDGQQRLTAIVDFMSEEYALEGLDTLHELNGSFYRDLPPFLKRRLEERTIKCLRIDSTVDDQVKYDIFERLNTGSVKLEAQELRNVTARGHFNDRIKKLAENKHFRAMIQVDEDDPMSSIKVQKMEDVELVLRFFALSSGRYRSLKKGFRDFLTASLSEFNKLEESAVKKMTSDFSVYMEFLYTKIGKYAFAKYRFDGETKKKMSSFNAAVYDAVAVGLSEVFDATSLRLDPDRATRKLAGFEILFRDREFFASVSGSVNDAQKVYFRINAMIEYLRK